jgi:hypothetical protein
MGVEMWHHITSDFYNSAVYINSGGSISPALAGIGLERAAYDHQ